MKADAIDISIVIPCLNEAETIAQCVHEALFALQNSGRQGEVVVADNGSSDDSVRIAEDAGARVAHVEAKGYGNAILAGIAAAKGEYVLMGDGDGSYDFTELPAFLKQLDNGFDLVMGCRFPRYGGRIESGAMPWKHRWIGNPVLSALGKLFFSSQVNDFHCGLRAFRRDAISDLNLKTTGMEFASEMVVKANLNNLKISQVPITLRCDGRSRPSHLRSWRDGWRHLRFMLLYSPNWLFIYPGLLLTVLGPAGFLVLVPQPLTIGSITFDLNSLLVSSVAILSGFQVFAMGVFMKAYSVNAGLMPGKKYWFKIVQEPAVEYGIAVGLVLIVIGFGVLTSAILDWKAADFGSLPYQSSLRKVITAVTAIALGIEVLFSGFALNILGLERWTKQ